MKLIPIKKKISSSDVPMMLDFRKPQTEYARKLEKQGIHPLLASLFSARGIKDISDVRGTIDNILSPDELLNCRAMAKILADCIENKKRVLIVSDYDCDGATACSVLISAFDGCGMNSAYLVPDREIHGYGLSESIVEEVANLTIKPDYIITVDAGISSFDGVLAAKRLGIEVLVTDHHHAPSILPDARLIVNPSQKGCGFLSKNIAGCGVAWYVALALEEEIKSRGKLPGFDAHDLLQFVALGTVADVVSLDKNNRILVAEGLKRIRSGQCTEGVKALAAVSGKSYLTLSCTNIGFNLAPRINAAGRLAHMSTGIDCLLSRDPDAAGVLARQLSKINEERREIQREMVEAAENILAEYFGRPHGESNKMSLVVFDKNWHQGVIGVVAGRIKEDRHRPTFVMCETASGVIKGSGRSIPGFHMKHALDKIAADYPDVILSHGGHPMAAGVSLNPGKLEAFMDAFEAICKEELTEKMLQRVVGHDGAIADRHLNLKAILAINAEVWGQGFPEPLFVDTLRVVGHSRMGMEKEHLRVKVVKGDVHVDLVAFYAGDRADTLGRDITLVYKAQPNSYNGRESVQLLAEHFLDADIVATYKADLEMMRSQLPKHVEELPDVLLSQQVRRR